MRLKDKVAIVTGAGSGIGEATALKFSAEGATVLLAGLPDDPVQDVADTIASTVARQRPTSATCLMSWPPRPASTPA